MTGDFTTTLHSTSPSINNARAKSTRPWRSTHDSVTSPSQTIDGRVRTVRELLDTAKYATDSYQREYAWQERQVRELIDDLTAKFLDSYELGHSRHEVEGRRIRA